MSELLCGLVHDPIAVSMNELRTKLRQGTAASHNRIDARLGALDLTTVEGLKRFLSAHFLVQSLYEPLLSEVTPTLNFIAELKHDLAALGAQLPTWTSPPEQLAFNEIGYRYVMTGSQLGAKTLHRAWKKSTNERVRAASQFLNANIKSRAWPSFLFELASIDAESNEVGSILICANQVFEVFDLAADELRIET